MKSWITAFLAVAIIACVAVSQDEAQPQWEPPKPTRHHAWLQQLVGEWTTEGEMIMGPDQPAMTNTGSESVRAVGGHWIISENKSEVLGEPFTGIMTLGYDTRKNHYIGTWIDSMTDYMWTYEGSLNEAGDTLTLKAEGPDPMNPGKTIHFRESLHIKDNDHRTFTSKMKDDEGNWNTMLTITYTRKK